MTRFQRIVRAVRYAVCFAAFAAALAVASEVSAESEITLSLDEAVSRALAASPRVARLESLEDAARAAREGARAAAFPQLDWNAGYTRYSDVPAFALPLPGSTEPKVLFPNLPDAYRSRFTLAVPLFTGGRIAGSVRSAREEEKAADRDLASGRADLALETATAYWGLVTSRERERVLGEALNAYEAHLKDARNRHDLGMAARNEVLSVQVERDRAELGRVSAAGGSIVSQAALRRLLVLPADVVIVPTDSLEGADGDTVSSDLTATGTGPDSLEVLVRAALESRPERAALAARAAAARERSRAEQGAQWPQLSAVAGYDYANPNRRLTPPRGRWDDSWDAGVAVSLSLFDGGRIRAAARRATAQSLALQHALTDLDAGIRLEVTSRLIDLETARAAVRAAGSAFEAAVENRRVTQDRYESGVVTSAELLDAEVVLLRAGLEKTDALSQIRLARIALARAAGRLQP